MTLIFRHVFSTTKYGGSQATARAERATRASAASEAIKIGSRAAVLRRRERTRFIVCERRRSRRVHLRDPR